MSSTNDAPETASSKKRKFLNLKPNQRLVIGGLLMVGFLSGGSYCYLQSTMAEVVTPVPAKAPPIEEVVVTAKAPTAANNEEEVFSNGMTESEMISAGAEIDNSHELVDTNECTLVVPEHNTEVERWAHNKGCGILVIPGRTSWCLFQSFTDDCLPVKRTDT